MTRAEFDVLVARRDDVQRQHAHACWTLEREGPSNAQANHRKCGRLYGELAAAQILIDEAIAARRAS